MATAILIRTTDDLDDFRRVINAFSRFQAHWTDEKCDKLDIGASWAHECEFGIEVLSNGAFAIEADLEEVIRERYLEFKSHGVDFQ